MISRFFLASLLISSISFIQATHLCNIAVRNDAGQTLFIDGQRCLAGSIQQIAVDTQRPLAISIDQHAMTKSERIYLAELQIKCDAARREYDDAVCNERQVFQAFSSWEENQKARRAKQKACDAYNDLKKVIENFKQK